MNEWLFLLHSFIVIGFVSLSLYLGKEALIVYISACWLFANFFISKEISLFSLEVTASDVYAIGGMFGLSLLQEYWGREASKLAVTISFVVLVFATLSACMHLYYTPSVNDISHDHYEKLLSPQARFLGASFITFAIAQQLDIFLFRKLRERLLLPFFIRASLTVLIVQFVDTALFTLLGLYGIVHSIKDVFIVSYTIKVLVTILTLPFIALTQYLLPKRTPA